MNAALFAVLPVAVGALVASIPVVAMAAVVAGSARRAVLVAFTFGWLSGLMVASVIGLLVFDLLAADADRATWVHALRAALGLVLVLLGARKVARRGGVDAEPGWMRAMSSLTAARGFAIAFALGSVNPKNLVIAVSAAAVVVDATADIPAQVAAMMGFVVVASLGVATPLVAIAVAGERVADPMGRFVEWFGRHSGVVLGTVLAVIGLAVAVPALRALFG